MNRLDLIDTSFAPPSPKDSVPVHPRIAVGGTSSGMTAICRRTFLSLIRLQREGRLNRVAGWISIAIGAGLGLLLGLWSFDGPVAVPGWIGGYAETPRRLIRLGHIAFFGLGMLNVLLSRELPWLQVSAKTKLLTGTCMLTGNLLLPPLLLLSALIPACKYLLPFPALGLFAAFCLTAYGLCQRRSLSS